MARGAFGQRIAVPERPPSLAVHPGTNYNRTYWSTRRKNRLKESQP